MSRKFIFSLAAAAAFIFAVSISAFAQFAPVNGTIELQNADGTKVPLAGATVEVYRTDIKTGFPSTKTDKKGAFAFAGLPFDGTFTLAVSGPGAAPMAFPGLRPPKEKFVLTLSPGDGHKLTEAEARSGAGTKAASNTTGASSGELTEDQKKAKAEYEKQVAAVNEKNARNQKNAEIVKAALDAGNQAFTSKTYDLAITKYTEGIDAEPNFIGSTPVLLNNRGAAYDARAVETYNKAAKLEDAAAKAEARSKAKADLDGAISSYKAAWTIYQTAPATDIVNPQSNEANKLVTLQRARDAFKHIVVTEQVTPEMIESAKVLMPEYEKVETDPAKKIEAGIILADLYRVTQDRENAIAAYKKVLESQPDNLDALAGVGLVLVDLSWLKDNDKTLAQEGANYLQKFVSLAPETHKLKEGAKGYLDILKTQSIVPVKSTTTKKRQ